MQTRDPSHRCCRFPGLSFAVAFLAALLALPVLPGCENSEGAFEEAGERIDEATDEAGDAIEDAADDLEGALDR